MRLAAGLHSFHDGIASFDTTGTKNSIAAGTSYATIGKGLTEGAALVVFSVAFLIIAFYVLKYFAARELVPPTPTGRDRDRPAALAATDGPLGDAEGQFAGVDSN
jgi:hypothetical protein